MCLCMHCLISYLGHMLEGDVLLLRRDAVGELSSFSQLGCLVGDLRANNFLLKKKIEWHALTFYFL